MKLIFLLYLHFWAYIQGLKYLCDFLLPPSVVFSIPS